MRRASFLGGIAVAVTAALAAAVVLVMVPGQARAADGEAREWDLTFPESYSSMIDHLRNMVSGGVLREGVRDGTADTGTVVVRVSEGGDNVVRFLIRRDNLYVYGFDTGPHTTAFYFSDLTFRSNADRSFGMRRQMALPQAGNYPSLPHRDRAVTRNSALSWLRALRNYGVAYDPDARITGTSGSLSQLQRVALMMFIQMISEAARFHPISAGVRAGINTATSSWDFNADMLAAENNWGTVSDNLRRSLNQATVVVTTLGNLVLNTLVGYATFLAVARRPK